MFEGFRRDYYSQPAFENIFVKLFGPVLRPFDSFYVKSLGQGKAGAGYGGGFPQI
jgi:hypothetical protein